jgi:hypothetical protein
MSLYTRVTQVCKNCGTKSTPFWRKDKNDGLPLCNACGLYFSKNDAPRPKILWKQDEQNAAAAREVGLCGGGAEGRGEEGATGLV